MRRRIARSIVFALAILMAASSLAPLRGLAEAQMRCVGMPANAAPCATMTMAAGDAGERMPQSAMACCRTMTNCPMAARATTAPLVLFAASRCIVTVRVITCESTRRAEANSVSLLASAPANAPPVRRVAENFPAANTSDFAWTYSPTLSPHAAPALLGLRAPPAV